MLYVPPADMYGQMRSAGCYAQRTEGDLWSEDARTRYSKLHVLEKCIDLYNMLHE